MIRQAVILAAGRGTRLGALTTERPKSMLPIVGRPILARLGDDLREAGIRRLVVVLGAGQEAVAAYLHGAWGADVALQVVFQPKPTGTVDALELAAPYLEGPFLLSAVDNLTALAHIRRLIARFGQSQEALATLSLLPARPEEIRRSAGVEIEADRVIAIEEKPARPPGPFAAIMLYAFAGRFLDYLSHVPPSARAEREIVSAIQAGLAAGEHVSYVVADARLHLTSAWDLLDINRAYLREGRDAEILTALPRSVCITPPVRIDPGVSLGESASIGPYVYLETGAAIGPGATLEESVVLRGGIVRPGEHCRGALIARQVRIVEES